MLTSDIYEMDETSDSPEVNVRGYGQMTLDNAKTGAVQRIEKALAAIKENPNDVTAWKNAQHVLIGSGVVDALMAAIIVAQAEQEGYTT